MAKTPKERLEGDRPQKEAEQRRDAIIRKLLETPPKPRKPKDKGAARDEAKAR